jgi:hypothetical protein
VSGPCQHDQQRLRARLFQGLQEGIGAGVVQRLRAFDDPNLVAAAVALERERLDEVSHLIHLDLGGVLFEPRDVQIGMAVGAQQLTSRAHAAGPLAARVAQRKGAHPGGKLLGAQPWRRQHQDRLRQFSCDKRGTQLLLRAVKPRQRIGAQEIHERATKSANMRAATASTESAASRTTMRIGSAAARAR